MFRKKLFMQLFAFLAAFCLCILTVNGVLAQSDAETKEFVSEQDKTHQALLKKGFSADELNQPVQLKVRRAIIEAQVALIEQEIQDITPLAFRQQGAIDVLSSRLKTDRRLRRRAKLGVVMRIGSRLGERARILSKQKALEGAKVLSEETNDLLEKHIRTLDVQLASDLEKQKEEALRKQREAEQKKLTNIAKKKAADDAEQARQDLQRAKKISSEIEKVQQARVVSAERIQVLTSSLPKTEKDDETRLSVAKTFHVTLTEEIKSLIRRTPETIKVKRAQKEVDPKFEVVRKALRDAMALYAETQLGLSRAQKNRDKFETLLTQSKEDESSLKKQAVSLKASELLKAREKLTEIQIKHYQLELKYTKQRIKHFQDLKKVARSQIDTYKGFISDLLPRISPEQKASFFDLTSDQNWEDARTAVKLGVKLVAEHIQLRFFQLFSLPKEMASVGFWSWILFLMMRLAMIVVVLRVASKNGPRYVRKMTDSLLSVRLLSRYPSLVIKFGEVVRHILMPLLRLLSIYIVTRYLRSILPELNYLFLIIKALFIFRITTIIVSVLILPRALRSQNTDERGFDLDELDKQAGVDVFNVEIKRAKKFVRSAKVIIWFWLLVLYVPALVVAFMGHTVIWRVVDLATMWFLVIVIYSVLTTWKDDVANLFERLAEERLPRAVSFVNSNKDRVWGVLVIALASVYVIVQETARLTREYLLEREWSKRLSNFIFRKKIELQQRENTKKQGDVDYTSLISSEYKSTFRTDRCLWDEPFLVERNVYLESIIDVCKDCGTKHKQGSVALIGETGIGKTTLLNQLDARLREMDGKQNVTYLTIFTKMTGRPGVFRLIRRLFNLGPEIKTKAQLVRAIRRVPRQIIIVDDCHHLFLRQIGGFAGLELFLEIVNLTDAKQMWVLSFNRFAWYYLARLKHRDHYFGKILAIAPWSELEVESLITTRNMMAGQQCNFSDLVVAHEPSGDDAFSYEVIKSSKGYFRLLHEFAHGNPRVAMTYWLRSLKPNDEDDTLQVSLFRRPVQRVSQALPDNYWFALTAIAQHGALSASEMAGVINTDLNFCETAINFFSEMDVVVVDGRQRARLRSLYFRQVLKYLVDSNYLYE